MALAERKTGENELLASLDLPYMKEVRDSLTGLAEEAYGENGLKGLRGTTPEEQTEIVKRALNQAQEAYQERSFHDKVASIGKIEKAYDQGMLTLPDLLQGLGIETQEDNDRRGLFGRLKNFLGRDKTTGV